MIEIVYFKEEKLIQKLQLEVQASIRKILKILDDDFDPRQTNYYADAGRYLGLIDKKKVKKIG